MYTFKTQLDNHRFSCSQEAMKNPFLKAQILAQLSSQIMLCLQAFSLALNDCFPDDITQWDFGNETVASQSNGQEISKAK